MRETIETTITVGAPPPEAEHAQHRLSTKHHCVVYALEGGATLEGFGVDTLPATVPFLWPRQNELILVVRFPEHEEGKARDAQTLDITLEVDTSAAPCGNGHCSSCRDHVEQ